MIRHIFVIIVAISLTITANAELINTNEIAKDQQCQQTEVTNEHQDARLNPTQEVDVSSLERLEPPVVQSNYGPIQGTIEQTLLKRNFRAFRGIPFAKPPVGSLRFRAPEKPEAWTETYMATADKNDCLQKNYLMGGIVTGAEDCLYLNVYTPNTPTNTSSLPVLFYIYGGGWFAGSGSSALTGPRYIMDEDVILVTTNYRLGVFGFLSTGTNDMPGNWGLKDQIAALQWVQENIHFFNGNPNAVTVFGQSAGSASINYHLFSPLARGLFQQVILQSGTSLSPWAAVQKNPATIFDQQAAFVGCDKATIDEKVLCVRKMDAMSLLHSGDGFKFWLFYPITTYTPVVEMACSEKNPSPYLLETPFEQMLSGVVVNPVPTILGVVHDEGVIGAGPIVSNQSAVKYFNENFDTLGPKVFMLDEEVEDDKVQELWRNITSFYFNGSKLNERTGKALSDVFGDRGFTYGAYKTAMMLNNISVAPLYFYEFDYRGAYSYSKYFTGTDKDYGVSHCDDLLYLFDSIIFGPLPPADRNLKSALVKLWVNFATYGDPTPTNDNPINVKWQPLTQNPNVNEQTDDARSFKIPYLRINKNVEGAADYQMQSGLLEKRMAFWESLPLRQNQLKTVDSINRL